MDCTKEDDLIKISQKELNSVFEQFKTEHSGLHQKEVNARIKKFGPNLLLETNKKSLLVQYLLQFVNPLVLLLFGIAAMSYFFGSIVSAVIILLMGFLSTTLSFIQEHHASKNAEKLRSMVRITANVIRDGRQESIPLKELVPGDIIELSAGKMIPADVYIYSSKDLFINQSALNGESFPAFKSAERSHSHNKDMFLIPNLAFMGTNVVGGFGQAVVLRTGKNTEFGKLSFEITKSKTETSFDRGINGFTWLMIRLIFFLCVAIFLINAFLKGNPIEALLFSLAVAIGLAPEMLPMIVAVNLSKGALKMAKKKVIIKELNSIQNFGAMDVLCTDKTGTLTLDEVVLVKHCDLDGKENEKIARFAFINSKLQSGMQNLLDKAVIHHHNFNIGRIEKIDEIPFDFTRRILSVVAREKDDILLICKGAPEAIIKKSDYFFDDGQIKEFGKKETAKFRAAYEAFSREGFRVLAVAYKRLAKKDKYDKADENELIFLGFIAFLDPPKKSAAKAIAELQELGINLKVISGDNELVTAKICSEVDIKIDKIVLGESLEKLSDHELRQKVEEANIFCRLTPFDKERVIEALQKNGHTIGFLGDGINDSPSLKKADVGISVDNATDIAKETAEIILLEKDLSVLSECVKEGRKTFANVIKYIKMGASSNFGNMFSMTGASLFLPFLPMLPTQVLLNNFLYDISQATIPSDKVDPDYLKKPRPWDIKFIKNFIIYVGPISSIFDFLTFFVMLWVFKAPASLFQTGWFVESLTTQVLIVHIIRTNKIPFIESRPSKLLLVSTLLIVGLGILIPYLPFAKALGFEPLPPLFFLILFGISMSYLLTVQLFKGWFIKRFGYE
jgi:Mg2+-importing ATPase